MKDLAQNRAQLQAVLHDVVDQVRKTAPSIYREAVETAKAEDRPAPRRRDFERFGIAVVTREAGLAAAGNAGMAFPIQSISKVFALEIALEAMGEKLWERMGREPSGDPFNSIIDLERDKGIPRNPLINAGALVVCDILVGLGGDTDQNRHVVGLIARMLDGQAPDLHPDVMKSDRMGGNLNRSLMFMTKHHGNLTHSVEEVMDAYIHQCAIKLDCRGLAKAGRFLMDDGTAGENGSVAAARRARRVLSIMMTCGLYDGAGEFAYRVGLPAKSGVGGGILAIVPERASIAVWSPALDPMGNSWLGTVGLELLAERTDWSVFGAIRH